MNKDLLGGFGLLVVAGAYYLGIGSIADSTLSDEVGAAGLPRMLALFLAVIAVAIMARAVLAGRAVAAANSVPTADADEEDDDEASATLPRAIGLLLFGAAYVAILPFAGYLLSITLLIAGIALYEGAARSWKMPVIALGGAVFYWAVFVKLLGVHQPAGLFFSGWLS
jgi:hypothetical protein